MNSVTVGRRTLVMTVITKKHSRRLWRKSANLNMHMDATLLMDPFCNRLDCIRPGYLSIVDSNITSQSKITFEVVQWDLSWREVGSFKWSQFVLLQFNLDHCQVMLGVTLPGSIPLICCYWRVRASWATFWIKAGSSTSSSAGTETVIGPESSKVTTTLLSASGLTCFIRCCRVTWKWVEWLSYHLCVRLWRVY